MAGAVENSKVRRIAIRLEDRECLRADFEGLAAPVPVLIVVTGFQERAGQEGVVAFPGTGNLFRKHGGPSRILAVEPLGSLGEHE